jgi:hypothetical protein
MRTCTRKVLLHNIWQDMHQLVVNAVELLSYVMAMAGKSLRCSTGASLLRLERTEDERLDVSRAERLNLRYGVKLRNHITAEQRITRRHSQVY